MIARMKRKKEWEMEKTVTQVIPFLGVVLTIEVNCSWFAIIYSLWIFYLLELEFS